MHESSSGFPCTIARLAGLAGVSVETVRYYQRRGLLREPARPPGGVRRYNSDDADRLRFIKRAQAMGFTLAEIPNLIRLRARRSCRATRALAAAKVQHIDERLHEMQRLRRELVKLIAECDANSEDSACPAIESLSGPSTAEAAA